ncbi:endolytic transglycosylase MltG [Thiofilum flexile]|uniref:endolytic transglycosylase MltG n=1 Tax=Thiofilum flexile TaxID=125627 RepID=UPI00036D0B01|nr:endolytic transglycosylase MltG [Thiofilum flexile]
MKKALLIGFSVVLLLALIGAGWGYQQYTQFLDTPLPIAQTTPFTIKPGSTTKRVAQDLRQANLLPDSPFDTAEFFFQKHAQVAGHASKIKAGEYELVPGMTVDDILKRFTSGQTVQYQLSIIEGKAFKDIMRTIKNHPDLQQTLTDEDYANLMPLLGQNDYPNPEGWFFPDTYHFPRNMTDKEFLQRGYRTMYDYLLKAWDKREPNAQIKTPYEALILASVVEKETGVPEERPLIAGLFLNRLAKGMLLQTDPTVIYGLGDQYDGNLRKVDLQRDTPYNSYTRKGLPPTPIATPSKAAIDAVMHPAQTDALYFVATGNGGHNFSKTYAEHQRAVASYLKELRNQRNQQKQQAAEPKTTDENSEVVDSIETTNQPNTNAEVIELQVQE